MKELLRDNIANLVPYRSARNDFSGKADVYLDANENWRDFLGAGRNRYPDPLCTTVRKGVEEVLGLPFDRTVIGNGSDEIIDNLYRMFCVPGKDSSLIMSPTYGTYRVFADINDVRVRDVPLTPSFAIDMPSLIEAIEEERNERTTAGGRLKLLFVCSPNNPSGNAQPLEQIEQICSLFDGIVVVDEAYHDFCSVPSAIALLHRFPNLVVLRTLSKGWALANARLGICVSSPELRQVMEKMKYPYNVGGPSQEEALRVLQQQEIVMAEIQTIVAERKRMERLLVEVACVMKVFPSDANFLLVKVSDADDIYRYLAGKGIIVRNRSKERHCDSCLRITVGSRKENDILLAALRAFGMEEET